MNPLLGVRDNVFSTTLAGHMDRALARRVPAARLYVCNQMRASADVFYEFDWLVLRYALKQELGS